MMTKTLALTPITWSLVWRIVVSVGRTRYLPFDVEEAIITAHPRYRRALKRECSLFWASLVIGLLVSFALCMIWPYWFLIVNAVTFPAQHATLYLPMVRRRLRQAIADAS